MAPEIDKAMMGLLVVCGAAFFLICALIFVFGIRYRKEAPTNRKLKNSESLALEWGWTIATLVLFLGLFFWGVIIYFRMHVPPLSASEISVVGKQWMWKFQHPNGRREINELHIPVSQPILLKMISQDVIHSLFVPEFRLKQDVLPGRYTKAWFQASEAGTFHLFCTQYCGTMHAQMIGRVVVLTDQDYERWLAGEGAENPHVKPISIEQRGQKLFDKLGCISCHASGTARIGPPLEGLYGSKVRLTTKKVVVADDNYIRESILDPNAKVVDGFQPLMPSFRGRVTEEELLDLVAYIKSLTLDKNTKIKPFKTHGPL